MIVDLSNCLENDVPADPPGFGPKIEYMGHKRSLPEMLAMVPGLTEEQLPNGEAWGFSEAPTCLIHSSH